MVNQLPNKVLTGAAELLQQLELPAERRGAVCLLVVAHSMVRRGRGGATPKPAPHQDTSLDAKAAARAAANRNAAACGKVLKKVEKLVAQLLEQAAVSQAAAAARGAEPSQAATAAQTAPAAAVAAEPKVLRHRRKPLRLNSSLLLVQSEPIKVTAVRARSSSPYSSSTSGGVRLDSVLASSSMQVPVGAFAGPAAAAWPAPAVPPFAEATASTAAAAAAAAALEPAWSTTEPSLLQRAGLFPQPLPAGGSLVTPAAPVLGLGAHAGMLPAPQLQAVHGSMPQQEWSLAATPGAFIPPPAAAHNVQLLACGVQQAEAPPLLGAGPSTAMSRVGSDAELQQFMEMLSRDDVLH